MNGCQTHGSIMIFIIAMAMNPSVQARAQEELNTVVGKDRLPTFSDRDSLPYIRALILEVLRWGSIVPLNVPHRLTEEDVYNGMRIPKGATVIANMRFYDNLSFFSNLIRIIFRGMLYDENQYPEPTKFEPERFLHRSADTTDPRNIVFGYGRRHDF